MQRFLQDIYIKHRLTITDPAPATFRFHYLADQVSLLLEENITFISLTFGIPDDNSLQQLKAAGCILTGTATCVAEAIQLADKGIDIITAQGWEAGGHRGSFLRGDSLPQVGTFALVPQIVDSVSVPVIAAGGIMDGRGIAAALILGAQGVQPGSVFLRCPESLASPAYKQAVANSTDTSTRLTQSFSGRWARGIQNEFMNALHHSGPAPLPYPVQDAITRPMRNQAKQQDNAALLSLWAGQAAALAPEAGAGVIVEQLMQDAERVLGRDHHLKR